MQRWISFDSTFAICYDYRNIDLFVFFIELQQKNKIYLGSKIDSMIITDGNSKAQINKQYKFGIQSERHDFGFKIQLYMYQY